ncbi:MAG: DHH family phosphoesterase [Thermoleophilia bacterium]
MTDRPAARMVTVAEVAARLRGEKRILVVTHESPDGDALGSLVAFRLVAERLGIAVATYVPGNTPFPSEYSFLPHLTDILRGAPPQVDADTTVYMLDCASLLRSHGHRVEEPAYRVNIDHHQDNPGYAEENLLVPDAPSTTAILYDVFQAGGFTIDTVVATALYLGLLTDTGRFQYSNTTAAAHRMAASLIDVGLDVNYISRMVYEQTPLPKLLLLRQALSRIDLHLGGLLVTAWVSRGDFAEAGAEDSHTEGIIDQLRCLQGVRVAAFLKERNHDGRTEYKVSLRSTDGTVDVAHIANKQGGGGHIRAAGFTYPGDLTEAIKWLQQEVAAQL